MDIDSEPRAPELMMDQEAVTAALTQRFLQRFNGLPTFDQFVQLQPQLHPWRGELVSCSLSAALLIESHCCRSSCSRGQEQDWRFSKRSGQQVAGLCNSSKFE